ncbi:hypothetical protein [Fibrella forsythiae]|uniref:Outer membrane protein beta-barrel domain-containing protein n=1 Tax=Fibrella forsythiae TaxID=2817061 RepID=A0ABS3JP62_9BACT|nr:hypothetical protein [Fibrella forsythiae]MBO0951788.1 hypothetical protein [Fibrella forsythiae]
MNSSDDSTDKALKERFQQLFNEFERTPSSSLKKQIWKHVPAASTPRYRYVVLALLLLLIGGALYGPQRMLTRQTTHIQPKRPASAQQQTGSSQSQKRSVIHSNPSASDSDGPVTTLPDPSANQTITHQEKQPNMLVATTSSMPRQPVRPAARVTRPLPASAQVRLSAADRQTDQLTGRRPPLSTGRQANPVPLLSTPVHPSMPPVVADSVFGQAALAALQPMVIRPFHVPDHTLTKQVVQLPQQPTEATIESRRPPLQWLASVAPLSTYQWMTVMARPETYVQQVGAPAAFSAPTWGYQVSGGLVWRQFTVQLMAGQLRRWAYYELATNEYRIESTAPNEYRITRLGRSIMENSSLTMLGASLGKEYTLGLGKRPGRYAARVGGQGTYLPATGQTLLWGQASLTMAVPLKNAYAVQLGPTVQYGFSRLFSGDRQLVIHPFLVGASLTIRPAAH